MFVVFGVVVWLDMVDFGWMWQILDFLVIQGSRQIQGGGGLIGKM